MHKLLKHFIFASLSFVLLSLPMTVNASTVSEEGIYVKKGNEQGVFYTIEEFGNLSPLDKIELIDIASNFYLFIPGLGIATLEEMNATGDFSAAILSNDSLGTSDPSSFLQGSYTKTSGSTITLGESTTVQFEIISID